MDRITDETPSLAPVLRETKLEYSVVSFNGTFMHEDIYRQTGSPEVDAAWEALGVDCKSTATQTVTQRPLTTISRQSRGNLGGRRPTKRSDHGTCPTIKAIRQWLLR
jgi:hypothetical protein